MATTDQIKNALLTEHFRYTPLVGHPQLAHCRVVANTCKTLLDDIINTVNEIVFQTVNAIEESLLNADVENLGFTRDDKGDIDTIARTEIEAGIVQLESLLNATIDRNFDKLEIYTLRNLLTVSNLKEDEGLEDWIMLDHYKDIKNADLDAKDASTPDSITRLRRKVQETERLQTLLKAEATRNEAILARLRSLSLQQPLKPPRQSLLQSSSPVKPEKQSGASLQFLATSHSAADLGLGANTSSQSLAQNTRFTLLQLPALKALLEELRPHIASVSQAGVGSEAEQAREAYLDTQSKRAMARNGVDPTATTGGTEGLGRAIGQEEVKALESIAGQFGNDGQNFDRMEE